MAGGGRHALGARVTREKEQRLADVEHPSRVAFLRDLRKVARRQPSDQTRQRVQGDPDGQKGEAKKA